MESVAKNLLIGIKQRRKNSKITVACNNHMKASKDRVEYYLGIKILRYRSFFLKSQPISLCFKSLNNEIKNADIVHHHYPFPTMEFALLKNIDALRKKKFIITWHANIQNSRWSWIERFYNPLIIKLLEAADEIIVTSPQLLEYSNILQIFKNKIAIIPLSFEPHNLTILPKELDQESIPKLLFVGKLRTYKGLMYLLEAINGLNVNLDIVGNGEEENNIREYIKNNNLNKVVHLYTNVNDEELVNFYKSSDIFVLPSVNEAEAFGVVQLEALSYGLPVINTNLKSGVPFVSLNNITGLTVDPANKNQLRNAILKLTSDKDLYNEFSKNAIKRSESFTNDKMVESYLNLYEN